MLPLRTLAIAATTLTIGLAGCAQTPVDHGAHHPAGTPAAGKPMAMAIPMPMPMPMSAPGAPMARMDEQMKLMQLMHEKMMQANTPEQRSALMAEHMKVMQDGMAMMGGMGGMKDKPAMKGMEGMGSGDGEMGMHHQMLDRRMQMMQSMMQMMMDRMPAAPAKP